MSIVRRKEELGKTDDAREYVPDRGTEVSSVSQHWAPPRSERTRPSNRLCLKCRDRCRIVEHREGRMVFDELRCFKGHSFWQHLNSGSMLD